MRDPERSAMVGPRAARTHMYGFTPAIAILLCLIVQATGARADSDQLSLAEAVALATGRADPTRVRHDERAGALRHRAVAAAQLPDPEVRLGLANWPVESFDYDQEPMTQVQAGVRQRFPRGETLSILGRRHEREADAERARGALALADIARATRRAWLELYYLAHADEVVRLSRAAVSELVDVVTASFATGLQNNQDLLRAELELSLLEDRAL